MQLDLGSEYGVHVLDRLQNEIIIWLTTIGGNGAPQPSPVWFLWQDETLLIYSRPNTPKLRNIAANPHVALNFNSSSDGGDVVVFAAGARLAPDAPPANAVAEYVEKYTGGIANIGMTPESFAAAYSVPIRVTPAKVRGF